MPIQKPCLNCGELTPKGSRCAICQRRYDQAHPRPPRKHYGGDYKRRAKEIRDTAQYCWLCGLSAKANDPWTADHIIAGDPNSPLAAAHRSCNSRRGNKPINRNI